MPEASDDSDPSAGPAGGDQKVKELLDAATQADLERWFGLPSFEQLAEQRPVAPAEDADTAAARKRREDAIAAVDPALVEAHRLRVEPPREMIQQRPEVRLNVDPEFAPLDQALLDRFTGIAEPREVELPMGLDDDLRDCTPQALLRDLHRPELFFDKVFEVVDALGEQRQDSTAIVAEVMTMRLRLPPRHDTPFQEARALLLELRAERRQPWTDIKMPLRRVTE